MSDPTSKVATDQRRGTSNRGLPGSGGDRGASSRTRELNSPYGTMSRRCSEPISIRVPADYAEFERIVMDWQSRCVQSRTKVAGVPARREVELVANNPSLRRIWQDSTEGEVVAVYARYTWGQFRATAIDFYTDRKRKKKKQRKRRPTPKPNPNSIPTTKPATPAPPTSVYEAIAVVRDARTRLKEAEPDIPAIIRDLELVVAYYVGLYKYKNFVRFQGRNEGWFKNMAKSALALTWKRSDVQYFVGMSRDYVQGLVRRLRLQKNNVPDAQFELALSVLQSFRGGAEVAAGEALSFEVRANPYSAALARRVPSGLSKQEARMWDWLRFHRKKIRKYATAFKIDRRAVAGVIAWEAMFNVMRSSPRSVGPGKMHLYDNALGGFGFDREDALPDELEARGYVSKKTEAQQERWLATVRGSLEYISAGFRAAADITQRELKIDISYRPEVLVAFYHSFLLKDWEARMQEKRTKGDATFAIKSKMALWVDANLDFLDSAMGRP